MTTPDSPKVELLLFAAAREAAGTSRRTFTAGSVGDLIEAAGECFGDGFREVADRCRIWVNGQPASPTDRLADGDEVAVLPPVSGGCGDDVSVLAPVSDGDVSVLPPVSDGDVSVLPPVSGGDVSVLPPVSGGYGRA